MTSTDNSRRLKWFSVIAKCDRSTKYPIIYRPNIGDVRTRKNKLRLFDYLCERLKTSRRTKLRYYINIPRVKRI